MKTKVILFLKCLTLCLISGISCANKDQAARTKLDPWVIQNGLINPSKVAYFRKEALAGNKVASDYLYRHYRRSGDPQAIDWLRLAVAQGYVTAMKGLSVHLSMYQTSSEAAQKESELWFLIFSRSGDSLAKELPKPKIEKREDVLKVRYNRLFGR